MARNLCADHCVECGYGPVMLHDVAGKPLELRALGKYVPAVGARWDCPRCKVAYFAQYRTRGDCADCFDANLRSEPWWELDLSYWSTYNDEPDYEDMEGHGEPRGLVSAGLEDQRTFVNLQTAKKVPNPGVPRCLCGYQPTLADVAGKPLELRSLEGEVPRVGVRLDCSCGRALFVHYRKRGACVNCSIRGIHSSDFPGTWELDVYYWSSYGETSDGDSAGVGAPFGLVVEGHEHQRHSLTSPEDVLHLIPRSEPTPRSRPSALAERVAPKA